MADWRQIQARIRKAKNSPDAAAKLTELFQRTRDGMVAFELAAVEEKGGRLEEAANWYATAAQRFRRAEWKKKAEEALVRLGAVPAPAPEENLERAEIALGELREEGAVESETEIQPVGPAAAAPTVETGAAASAAAKGPRRRRRGRRGGRGRRRKGAAAVPALPAQAFAAPSHAQEVSQPAPEPRRAREVELPPVARVETPVPTLPSERVAHGRAGDPALASRMAHLESLLRRLIGSPLHRLDEVDEAPAGPGVFLLSDSDLVTSYYVEACQTLRVGLGNLLRSGRGGKPGRGGRGAGEHSLKSKLAEHLEISESKVSQYLKDHCVVRWIQLDDESPHLAHFAIGVLRTPLNAD